MQGALEVVAARQEGVHLHLAVEARRESVFEALVRVVHGQEGALAHLAVLLAAPGKIKKGRERGKRGRSVKQNGRDSSRRGGGQEEAHRPAMKWACGIASEGKEARAMKERRGEKMSRAGNARSVISKAGQTRHAGWT